MNTVRWQLSVDDNGCICDEPVIVGGTLPPAEQNRLLMLLFKEPYGIGTHYFADYLDQEEIVLEPHTPALLLIGMHDHWDQLGGPPDELLRVEQKGMVVWFVPLPKEKQP